MPSMRQSALTLCLLAGTTAPAAGQMLPGGPTVDWERSRAEYSQAMLREYNELITDWRENLTDGDASRSAQYYTEGALMIVTGRTPLQGRDAIRSYLDSINATLVELRTGLVDFVASDNLAYASGPVLYRFREESGAVRSLVGQHVTVVTKEGRRWRIRSQVFNYVEEPES